MSATSGLSERLRSACADEWEALHEHPFVRGLVDGTLQLDTFRFYIEQNLQYLPEYARAMAIAAGRADDVDTMRIFASELANVLESEIPQNRALLEHAIELGAADDRGQAGMAPATVAYTSFLVATASRSGPLELMAAIIPCTWSYGDIGMRRRSDIAAHPVYAEWIRFFGSADYVEIVAAMRRDFERLAAGAEDVSEERLRSLFATSVRLERGFWDMAFDRALWSDARASIA